MDINQRWQDLFAEDADPLIQADTEAHIALLDKLVAISSHLLHQEIDRTPRPYDESTQLTTVGAVSAILRRLIELLESSVVLLRANRIPSSSILVRTIIELLAELAFLLNDSHEIAHRVRCYMMWELYSEKRMLEDRQHDLHDDHVKHWIQGRIAELDGKLAMTYFNPIRKDFNEVLAENKYDKWYTLATWKRTRFDGKQRKYVSGKITTARWLIANVNKTHKNISYAAYSLLSNFTHSGNLLAQSIGINKNNVPELQQIGERKPDDHRDFVRAVISTFTPLVAMLTPRMTPTQRGKFQLVWSDFEWNFNRLYNEKSSLREDPVFLLRQLQADTKRAETEAKRVTDQNAAAQQQMLADYADQNRKYPEGYTFKLHGVDSTLGRAWAIFGGVTITIVYAVLSDGAEEDMIAEKNINHPKYI